MGFVIFKCDLVPFLLITLFHLCAGFELFAYIKILSILDLENVPLVFVDIFILEIYFF